MIAILPSLVLFGLFIFLFFREIKLERERFIENHRLADEHVLREVERFLKEQESKARIDSVGQ